MICIYARKHLKVCCDAKYLEVGWREVNWQLRNNLLLYSSIELNEVQNSMHLGTMLHFVLNEVYVVSLSRLLHPYDRFLLEGNSSVTSCPLSSNLYCYTIFISPLHPYSVSLFFFLSPSLSHSPLRNCKKISPTIANLASEFPNVKFLKVRH